MHYALRTLLLLLYKQIHVHMLPGGTGDDIEVDFAFGCCIGNALHFGTPAKRGAVNIVDIAAEQLRHQLLCVFDNDDDNPLRAHFALIVRVAFKGNALPLDPLAHHKSSKTEWRFGDFWQG